VDGRRHHEGAIRPNTDSRSTTMKITRERPDTDAGLADWFTGSVFIDV
jgi:hypothetical protein